jgi:hypothetical protein
MDMTASGAGGVVRKRSEARQRTELVAIRLLPGERDQLAQAARNRNVSLSELIRRSALEAVTANGTERT